MKKYLIFTSLLSSNLVLAHTDIMLGGYIDAEYAFTDYNHGRTVNVNDFFWGPAIAVSGTTEDTDGAKLFNFQAKKTRFWLSSTTPTRGGNLNTNISLDFMGESLPLDPDLQGVTGYSQTDSFTKLGIVRLRTAYANWCGWTIGQDHSTFTDFAAMPELTGYGVPVGGSYVIQPVIRYTVPLVTGNLHFALENPSSAVKGFQAAEGSRLALDEKKHTPDLIAKYSHDARWGMLSGSIMYRKIFAGKLGKNSNNASLNTWSLNLSGNIDIMAMDKLQFMVNYGVLGRYMGYGVFRDAAASTAVNNDGTLNAGASLTKIKQMGGYLAYTHFYHEDLQSALVLSMAKANNANNESATQADKKYYSLHANILWHPAKYVRLGFEYTYGKRKHRNGNSGNVQWLSFSAKYSFA